MTHPDALLLEFAVKLFAYGASIIFGFIMLADYIRRHGTMKAKDGTNRGGARPGAGRPKGSRNSNPNPDPRVNRLRIALSAEEWNELADRADKAGKPLATFAREELFR